jgi:hypothetical protein
MMSQYTHAVYLRNFYKVLLCSYSKVEGTEQRGMLKLGMIQEFHQQISLHYWPDLHTSGMTSDHPHLFLQE